RWTPELVETERVSRPLVWLMMSTSAPATSAPEASVITPVIVPRPLWAEDSPGKEPRRIERTIDLFIIPSSFNQANHTALLAVTEAHHIRANRKRYNLLPTQTGYTHYFPRIPGTQRTALSR